MVEQKCSISLCIEDAAGNVVARRAIQFSWDDKVAVEFGFDFDTMVAPSICADLHEQITVAVVKSLLAEGRKRIERHLEGVV